METGQLVTMERVAGVTIFTFGSEQTPLSGSLSDAAVTELLDSLKSVEGRVLFDMRNVEFCNSTFIGLLLRCSNSIKSRSGGELSLCQLHPYCREVMEVTNLSQLWKFYPDRDAAIQALTASS